MTFLILLGLLVLFLVVRRFRRGTKPVRTLTMNDNRIAFGRGTRQWKR